VVVEYREVAAEDRAVEVEYKEVAVGLSVIRHRPRGHLVHLLKARQTILLHRIWGHLPCTGINHPMECLKTLTLHIRRRAITVIRVNRVVVRIRTKY
jgi:hypothetical protein